MKYILGAVSAAALLASSAHAAPTQYTFTSSGWSEGGVFSGEFFAEDLDGDFQINSLNGEVASFFGTYQDQGEFVQGIVFSSLSGDFPGNDFPAPPGQLIFTLDGNGTIGDDEYRGVEGLSVSNGVFAIDIGPGPIGLCDENAACGAFGPSRLVPIDGPNGPSDDPLVGVTAFSDIAPSMTTSTMSEPTEMRELELELIDPMEEPNPLLDFAFATTTASVIVEGDIGSALGTEDRPFYPDFEQDDSFVFVVPDRRQGEIFFIDPIIAVGYTYVANGNSFLDVQAPSQAAVMDADGEYTLTVNGQEFTIKSGEKLNFEDLLGMGEQVTEFTITGIDTGLKLDPNNPLAFSTGVSTAIAGVGTISQTPITIDTDVNVVPLPAGAVLLLTGMGGLMVMRRRRKHA